MFRRVTVDANSGEIIADEFKAEQDVNFSFKQKLPGAPRDIVTRMYHYIGDDDQPITSLLHSHHEHDRLVKRPAEPSQAEIERHEITHTPFQPWCQHCIAGRSRGTLHRRLMIAGDDEVQADYTFWSEKGYEVTDTAGADPERAICSLTLVHKNTGSMFGTIVLQKRSMALCRCSCDSLDITT